ECFPDSWPVMAVLVEHMEGQRDMITHKYDPYYASEHYSGDDGDGTEHWQEDVEESSRAALGREELIEDTEQKVGGLREFIMQNVLF
ncbi:hypothetical protein MKX01_008751, partial [Papaver californicum]